MRLKVQTVRERRLPQDEDTTELLVEPGNINRSHCRYPLLQPRPSTLTPPLRSLLCSDASPTLRQRVYSSTLLSRTNHFSLTNPLLLLALALSRLPVGLPSIPPSRSQDPFPCTTSSRETATNEAKNIGAPELRPSQKRYRRDLGDGNGADLILDEQQQRYPLLLPISLSACTRYSAYILPHASKLALLNNARFVERAPLNFPPFFFLPRFLASTSTFFSKPLRSSRASRLSRSPFSNYDLALSREANSSWFRARIAKYNWRKRAISFFRFAAISDARYRLSGSGVFR